MIERYSREEMKKIWSLDSKFQYYLDVELAVCKAYNHLGKISNEVLNDIISKASFSVQRIDEIEKEVHHDLIAFLTNINENIGEDSRYVHMGLTSSDVIDTALALQMKHAGIIILKDIDLLIEAIRNKAKEHRNTVCIGRSHGVHAEPMTFGVKLCGWIDLFERNKRNFEKALEEASVGQISGPVGTYSNINPEIEQLACEYLGLKPAKFSTQVIARDIHAQYHQALALIACVIEQIAIELRHLQRTEVLEAEEGFSKGQKGSSAMPHKKNPISGENLSGLARIVRSNSFAALENIPLWHERDISHSSVERIIFPDSAILVDYMLNRLLNTIENLVVHKDNMLKNTNLFGGIVFSQKVLLKLCEKGLLREAAYKLVQRNALDAFNNHGSFINNLLKDNDILAVLSEDVIKDCFNINDYLNNIEYIYKKFILQM
ncbi:MAG: adenylosuccinate lyase [Candidatus Gastranaerophilales bacterium]|nr:adenylosuccinate lyase [Candidatus Gastranaerophilales bacterium]